MAITMNAAAAAAEAAAEAARREAEKERKRAALRAQIAEVDRKIQQANQCINELSKNNGALSQTVNVWKQSKARYQSSSIASQVVVINLFEGIVAEKIKKLLPEKVEIMEKRADAIGDVRGGIASQINKIREYISRLETQKSNLQAQLSAI